MSHRFRSPVSQAICLISLLALLFNACSSPQPHIKRTTHVNANQIQAITFDHAGNLWAVGEGGVVKWDVRDGTYTRYTVDDGLASNRVSCVAVAPDGALWFGTLGSGVSRFDGEILRAEPQDEAWTAYTTEPANTTIESIAVAPDGALWFGTLGKGILRFDGQDWTVYSQDDLPTQTLHVVSIAFAPDGTLWFGSHSGVLSFDGENWTLYAETDGSEKLSAWSVAATLEGTLWVGTLDIWFGTMGGVSHRSILD